MAGNNERQPRGMEALGLKRAQFVSRRVVGPFSNLASTIREKLTPKVSQAEGIMKGPKDTNRHVVITNERGEVIGDDIEREYPETGVIVLIIWNSQETAKASLLIHRERRDLLDYGEGNQGNNVIPMIIQGTKNPDETWGQFIIREARQEVPYRLTIADPEDPEKEILDPDIEVVLLNYLIREPFGKTKPTKVFGLFMNRPPAQKRRPDQQDEREDFYDSEFLDIDDVVTATLDASRRYEIEDEIDVDGDDVIAAITSQNALFATYIYVLNKRLEELEKPGVPLPPHISDDVARERDALLNSAIERGQEEPSIFALPVRIGRDGEPEICLKRDDSLPPQEQGKSENYILIKASSQIAQSNTPLEAAKIITATSGYYTERVTYLETGSIPPEIGRNHFVLTVVPLYVRTSPGTYWVKLRDTEAWPLLSHVSPRRFANDCMKMGIYMVKKYVAQLREMNHLELLDYRGE